MKNFCATLTIMCSAILYAVAESIEATVESLFN